MPVQVRALKRAKSTAALISQEGYNAGCSGQPMQKWSEAPNSRQYVAFKLLSTVYIQSPFGYLLGGSKSSKASLFAAPSTCLQPVENALKTRGDCGEFFGVIHSTPRASKSISTTDGITTKNSTSSHSLSTHISFIPTARRTT